MSDGLQGPQQELSNLLGLYKAEWLNGQLFELFTEPGYFGDLTTRRPCVLMGGRGTGKTTVLRGLSYEGRFALSEREPKSIKEWPYYGLYYRVNTNRVTAFRGPELTEDRWIKCFAHYVNLVFCQLILDFCFWYERETKEQIVLSPSTLSQSSASLHLGDKTSLRDFANALEIRLVEFEASINTIADNPPDALSMQGAPIDELSSALTNSQTFKGKQFFFLIDEFENFEDYQQRVLNTIIKHASESYTFKVGVRELGWRERSTLNRNEQLVHPADYAHISIAERLGEARFAAFADRVVNGRIKKAYANTNINSLSVQGLLKGLSENEEAELLLDHDFKEKVLATLRQKLSSDELINAENLPTAELFFLRFWSEGIGHETLEDCVRSRIRGTTDWKGRMVNHFYASLFSIRSGKRGIRKHYCGWDVFLLLANGNIRYLLELVHRAIARHFEAGFDIDIPISFDNQTLAAQEVGKKNLQELEGLSVEGANLTRLLLSLGRIFQILAEQPAGHTPEANQFHVVQTSTSSGVDEKVKRILDHAVMHQGLVRFHGNKPMDSADTREYDYMLHPIFAPFFVFSHRRKRRLSLDATQIVALVEQPKDAIKDILVANKRTISAELPDQLALFGAYYE